MAHYIIKVSGQEVCDIVADFFANKLKLPKDKIALYWKNDTPNAVEVNVEGVHPLSERFI